MITDFTRSVQPLSGRIAAAYRAASEPVGGAWHTLISLSGPAGELSTAVEQDADAVVAAQSVNKLAVATALLDRVDDGRLALTDTVELTADLVIADGDGIFRLAGAYPSRVTLGHVLAALLTVSDDTAVRLCGLLLPAAEVNAVLAAKGLTHTRVVPDTDPHRMWLGQTTPRETHDLLRALAGGTLLGPASTDYLLGLLRSPIACTDGIRHDLSSAQRARVATKAGWLADVRNEAGIIFDTAGHPRLTYALFADGQPGADDFGATHPAVRARARMGRAFLDLLDGSAAAQQVLECAPDSSAGLNCGA